MVGEDAGVNVYHCACTQKHDRGSAGAVKNGVGGRRLRAGDVGHPGPALECVADVETRIGRVR